MVNYLISMWPRFVLSGNSSIKVNSINCKKSANVRDMLKSTSFRLYNQFDMSFRVFLSCIIFEGFVTVNNRSYSGTVYQDFELQQTNA